MEPQPPSVPEVDWGNHKLNLYQGFWFRAKQLPALISFQKHFQAHDTDIIVASKPKCGTTWLKALVFAVTNRTRYTLSDHPLLTLNPHQLVPFFEYFMNTENPSPDLTNITSPRLISTHIPYISLPESIKKSDCRIVYVCRNPLDACISSWKFLQSECTTTNGEAIPLEKVFNMFYEGVELLGPFFDHALGYWKESLERPNKVLFLKYEDLKEDIVFHTKRLAEFLGFPFSPEEEKEGMIEEISKLCSFNNLKNLEINQTGKFTTHHQNKDYFRKGQIGDWTNYLTPSMVERFDKLMQEKLHGTGLTFKTSLQ